VNKREFLIMDEILWNYAKEFKKTEEIVSNQLRECGFILHGFAIAYTNEIKYILSVSKNDKKDRIEIPESKLTGDGFNNALFISRLILD
jgi:hypothetical protein